ncbi:putative cytochrome P450 monooxygenase [Tothia fuscella]|uniref:Cytochrome P450 monooxygenase n=1 Tax=Tothia fuscella TaxID=1048955 RepID=A0A9P4NSV9_9PEZI|nr:putative cytochrome P450 monooxygenase [Tothia fuscella]
MALLAQLYEAQWVVVSIAALLYALERCRACLRLSAFKGPSSTDRSEVWHALTILTWRSHLIYKDVTDKYGTIARVGLNELLTSSPEVLVHMNAVRSGYTRATWFNRSFQVDEEKHTRRRQQMAAGYTGRENPAYGGIKADADLNNYLTSGEEGLTIITMAAALGLSPVRQWGPIARAFGPSEEDHSGFGKMLATARSLIDSRLEQSTKEKSDMLASFIRHDPSREELLGAAILQVLAGSDTTATAVRSIMLYVITPPGVYARLQAEIDEAVETGKVPAAPAIIPDSVAGGLGYLQAVVREGLRIHPPVTDIVPKKVPPNGDTITIDGNPVFIHGGTNISYCAWGVHREHDGEEKLATIRRTTELIFRYGKCQCQCLGRPIAWMEVTKVIFEVSHHWITSIRV